MADRLSAIDYVCSAVERISVWYYLCVRWVEEKVEKKTDLDVGRSKGGDEVVGMIVSRVELDRDLIRVTIGRKGFLKIVRLELINKELIVRSDIDLDAWLVMGGHQPRQIENLLPVVRG